MRGRREHPLGASGASTLFCYAPQQVEKRHLPLQRAPFPAASSGEGYSQSWESMKTFRIFKNKAMNKKNMNYLVAVLANRVEAEAAYLTLQEADLGIEELDILGREYKSADEFGLINPNNEAIKQVDQLANWVIPLGFAAGYFFNFLTDIEIISWLGELGNHILGGLFGAAAGAFGAFVTGTLSGWTTSSGDAVAYRNRLNAGKYLIIAKGTDAFVEEATRLLRQYGPENLQGYVETSGA